ncbi:hypothetical protein PVAP13_3KG056527 [Panicum virgatum]|uniref:Uncharacterized protein n=1 Tax=Panicum virgatum TaxID=38727 RepID=A0A8T0UMZ2_PANVG|nr:hypothetical protein PVAP13_3KG056527 [Panicum virgatum]
MWGPYPSRLRLRLPLAGGAPCSLGASSLSGEQGPGPPSLRLLSLPAASCPSPPFLPRPRAVPSPPAAGARGWRRARALPAAAARAQGQRRRHARPDPMAATAARAAPSSLPPPLAARSRPLLLPPSRRFLPAAMGLGSGGRAGARLAAAADARRPPRPRAPAASRPPSLRPLLPAPLSLSELSRTPPLRPLLARRCCSLLGPRARARRGLLRPPRRGSARPPPSSSLAQRSRAPRRPRAAPFLLRRPHSARLSSACSRSAAAEPRRQTCHPRGHGGRHSPSPAPSVAQRRHGKDAAAEAREGRRRRGWGGREREAVHVGSKSMSDPSWPST